MNWKEFLKPSWKKSLAFFILALLLVPSAYYFSKGGVYCYPSMSTVLAADYCEHAKISVGTWQVSWMFAIRDVLEGVLALAPSLLAVPFIGALVSYLLACALIFWLAKAQKKAGKTHKR